MTTTPTTMRVSTGTRGRTSELIVQQDLLARGWEVFDAVSPNCKCDLMISRPGSSRSYRVEVKTTSRYTYPDGRVIAHTPGTTRNVFDVLAVVDGWKITYTPDPRP
jgi:hypothetical protein